MTPDRWKRAEEVFASAVSAVAETRTAYLDGACGGDAELRREVESLLASHEAASEGFLETPAIDGMESVAPNSPSRKPLARGARLGSFEIVGPLGAGGMGEVYRASDPRLGRDVAIKVLPGEVASDRDRLKRFEKEARSASALNHPNIVTIYETGSSDGVPWIAMEHVEGETLRRLIADGPLQIKKLLNVAVQIAEGLARAHEAGIVHRDLKPENVMVTKDGLVKILDFGLAKLSGPVSGDSDEESQLPTVTGTSPGIVLGTVGYMSPEQASGKTVDFRSDQFAFGSILYEMATGKRAFQKKTAVDTLAAILNDEPESVASLNPATPAPLRWIVERCLAKEPDGRYASTKDLARELAGVRDHLSEASGIATLGREPDETVPSSRRSGSFSRPWLSSAMVTSSRTAFATRQPAAFPESHVSAWDGPASPFRARRSDRRVRNDGCRGRPEVFRTLCDPCRKPRRPAAGSASGGHPVHLELRPAGNQSASARRSPILRNGHAGRGLALRRSTPAAPGERRRSGLVAGRQGARRDA